MLRDGEYVAWFRTSKGSETGRVYLRSGEVSGSDTSISYTGFYKVHGDGLFSMKLSTRRHLAGHASLLGADEVELTLAGSSKGGRTRCSGSVASSSDLKVDVTLFPVDEPKGCHLERQHNVITGGLGPDLPHI